MKTMDFKSDTQHKGQAQPTKKYIRFYVYNYHLYIQLFSALVLQTRASRAPAEKTL